MMRKIIFNTISLVMFFSSMQLQSCISDTTNKKMDAYKLIPVQKISLADSLFVIHTIKEWSNLNWWTFEDYSLMYKMENKDIEYFIGRVFYDPKKLKMVIWYGEKMYNAPTISAYTDDAKKNRICPVGEDTICTMSALIGFRDSIHQIWNLYPFDNQSVSCYDKEISIKVLEQYYYDKMKGHPMWHVVQEGSKKGELELKAYGYTVQDKDFWEKCWLWEKDTVGSNGLYPFQVKQYYTLRKGDKCDKCAKLYDIPKINYPEEILELFRKDSLSK